MHSQGGEAGHRALRVLWGLEQAGTRGPRARYSLAEVAGAGVALADQKGLEAVSLAALAGELDLTTTALYRYVDTKDVLIEIMVDAALGVPPGLRGRTWQARARYWALALARRYRNHRWLADVRPTGAPRYPAVYAWLEALVAGMDRVSAGRPATDFVRLGLVLDGLVRTFARFAPPSPGAETQPAPWLREAVAGRFPRLASEMDRDFADVDDELSIAIDTLLRGAAAVNG